MGKPLKRISKIDFNESFLFVVNCPDWYMRLLVLGLMIPFSIFIIPALILKGYELQLINIRRKGKITELPGLENWTYLVKIGFRYYVGFWIYFVIAAIVIFGILLFLLYSIPMETFMQFGESTFGDKSSLEENHLFNFAVQLLWLFAIISSFIKLLFVPFFQITFSKKYSYSDFYDFGMIKDFFKESIAFLILFALVSMGLSRAIGFVVIIPILGWGFMVWLRLILANIVGQYSTITDVLNMELRQNEI